MNVIQSEEAVQQANRDPTVLRNVDRPLYDLLMTKDSAFQGLTSDVSRGERLRAGQAVPVSDYHMLGDIPRLAHNLEETSFLSADQSKI